MEGYNRGVFLVAISCHSRSLSLMELYVPELLLAWVLWRVITPELSSAEAKGSPSVPGEIKFKHLKCLIKSRCTACILTLGELKYLAEQSLLRIQSPFIHHSILGKTDNYSGSDTAVWILVHVSNEEMHTESAAGLYLEVLSLLIPLYVLGIIS